MMSPPPSAVKRVIAHIKDVALSQGERLPSEEAICAAVAVSRGPVREAIKILEALGAVEIRRGIGTFILPQGFIALEYIMEIQAQFGSGTAKDMFELRLTVERAAAIYAASRRTAEDIARMERANEDMRRISESTPVDLDALTRADVAFHKAIYDAAQNPLLGTIGKFVTELVAPMIKEGHARVGGMRSVLNHEQIMVSIRAGDPDGAGQATALSPVAEGLAKWQEAISELSESRSQEKRVG